MFSANHGAAIFDDTSELEIRVGAMNDAVKTGEPRMMRIVHRFGKVELMRHEAVVLPVTSPDVNVRWALVFALYY